ncbi:MAG: DUF3352 domain-containing protein, partial [Flavobacteriaceae bacterium]
IIIFSLIALIGYLAYQAYVFFLAPTHTINAIYLVPKDAVYIIETQKPIENWDAISHSDTWVHLQKNDYFKTLTESLNGFDGIFNKQKKLIDFIGNRSVLISAHTYQTKKYGLLFIADLQKIAKLKLLKNHLNSFINDDYSVNKRNYHNHKIIEIYDKKSRETLYISFIENQLIASYLHSLVEASIDQYAEPVIGRDHNFIEINKKVGFDKMFRLYVQYSKLDDYLKVFSDKPNKSIQELSESLKFSGFHFNLLRNNIMLAKGFTNTNNSTATYLKALQKSGVGKRTVDNIAPKRTSIYLSFSFDSFDNFYKNFEDLKKKEPSNYKKYQDSWDKIENFLDISIKDNFISWIADEIAILQLHSPYSSTKNNAALVVKTNNKINTQKNLNFILKQIKKKTPVKFKGVSYKNYSINYLSIKGFFKVFLGDYFDKFDKPYYSIIDDYVVFSNNPNTIKIIIDDYIGKETLSTSEDYKDFNNYFDEKSSVYTYINTPVLYDNLYQLADNKTKLQIDKNKDFIICFPQIGFQLTPYVNLFKSKLIISYQDPIIVKSKTQFKANVSIGPSLTNSTITNNTNSNENILTVKPSTLFNIPQIYPEDLNAKDYITYFPNGAIKTKVSLKDGIRNGRYKEYYTNGEVKIKGHFKKGTQNRTWRAYDSNGNLLEKKRF